MPTKQKNYQQLSDELDEVLARLQDPAVSIDDSMELYQTGQKLIKQLEDYLAEAKNKVTKLNKSKGGQK